MHDLADACGTLNVGFIIGLEHSAHFLAEDYKCNLVNF